MHITSADFVDMGRLDPRFAFGTTDEASHVRFSDNRNPALAWTDPPYGARSLVLICVDPDVPTRPDDVNQEGRTVSASLPRCDFYHWVMVDIPPTTRSIAAGSCSSGVIAHGKKLPPGPPGSRQGVNDYTGWFAGNPAMGGLYFGYDGPCPPWNDERLHHYHFALYATDLAHCPVEGAFTGAEVEAAIAGHVVAEARIVGTYSLNPALK